MLKQSQVTLNALPLPIARLAGTWNSKARQFAKEGHSGVDRLGYLDYADALAGLFSTGSKDVLPAAVGIYAPWGGGKVGTYDTHTFFGYATVPRSASLFERS